MAIYNHVYRETKPLSAKRGNGDCLPRLPIHDQYNKGN